MTTPKHYQFLKTAQGSRDGLTVTTFQKGEVYELSDDLAEQLFHQGVITETTKAGGGHLTDEDTKSGEAGVPLPTQRIEELVSVARDQYGLNADSTMTEDQVRKMIEAAQAGPDARETKVDAPEETKPTKPAAKKHGK